MQILSIEAKTLLEDLIIKSLDRVKRQIDIPGEIARSNLPISVIKELVDYYFSEYDKGMYINKNASMNYIEALIEMNYNVWSRLSDCCKLSPQFIKENLGKLDIRTIKDRIRKNFYKDDNETIKSIIDAYSELL